MKFYFSYIITVILLCSCSVQYNVLLRADGTAAVNTELGLDDSFMNRLESSGVVSNVDTTAGHVSFEVSSIDSIGNYLPYHKAGYVSFDNYGDSILVRTVGTNRNSEIRVHLMLHIMLEEEVIVRNVKGKRIKPKTGRLNNGYWLSQGLKAQRLGKKHIYAVIKKGI